jgi:glycerophosphoryl diester phosphodiesterase
MASHFNLQGHRGARGLKPENTLPSFERAFDLGVSSIETDVHLTRDGIPVLIHDAVISERLFRSLPDSTVPEPGTRPLVRSLTLAQLRAYAADRNPDPEGFPDQDPGVTPLAAWFGEERRIHPMAPPALADLFAFAEAYCADPGRMAGKTNEQQAHVSMVRFDLELKREPFHPEFIGDGFDGTAPALLEQNVLNTIRECAMVTRTTVRSFDHRAVHQLGSLEPGLTTALLVARTGLISPGDLVRQAGAQVFCPDYEFLDETQVRRAHAHDVRVIPWTVNNPNDWERLFAWEVDGITTDFPDRLADWLARRGIAF